MTGIGSQYPADGTIGPRGTGKGLAELVIRQLRDQRQRHRTRRLAEGHHLIECLAGVLHLPFIGHGVNRDHDLSHRTGTSQFVSAQTNRIGVSANVTANHGGKVVFDERKVRQMIERRPQIGRIMLAGREATMKLIVGKPGVLVQQPDPTFVEFLLDRDSSHPAGLADRARPGPIEFDSGPDPGRTKSTATVRHTPTWSGAQRSDLSRKVRTVGEQSRPLMSLCQPEGQLVGQLVMDWDNSTDVAARIADASMLTGDREWDALVAGVVEDIAYRHCAKVPS